MNKPAKTIVLLLFIVFLTVNFPSVHATQTWNVQKVNDEISGTPNISVDSKGTAYITFLDVMTHDLMYAHFDGSKWVTQVVNQSLVLNPNINSHILYSGYDLAGYTYTFKLATWTGSSWNPPAGDGYEGMTSNFVLDSKGVPHIAYTNFNDLMYGVWNGEGWTTQKVAYGGISAILALDSKDNPHLLYYDNWGTYKTTYASWNGTGWTTQTINDQGYGGTLVLDSADKPHILYSLATETGNVQTYFLKYATWTGSKWDVKTIEDTGYAQNYNLALDKAGNPHVCFSYSSSMHIDPSVNTDYFLKYATFTGSNWNIQTVNPTGKNGVYCSLALDLKGNPHIIFEDQHSSLWYASLESSSSTALGNFTLTPTILAAAIIIPVVIVAGLALFYFRRKKSVNPSTRETQE
jgi:hypothetical protein